MNNLADLVRNAIPKPNTESAWQKSQRFLRGDMSPQEAREYAASNSFASLDGTYNNQFLNMDFAALAKAISQLGASGAGAQLAATRETNALNKEMWLQGEANTDRRLQQQMEFSHQEAQNAMDYQSEMSNTSHQREVADLIAAGLNPVLSASGQGASTPSGMMGGVSAASGNGFSAAQPNIVGAFTAAGEFLSNAMSLQQQMSIFSKEFNWKDKNKWLNLFSGMIGSFTNNMFSLLGRTM